MGIKRVAVTGKHGESEATLRRVRHLFVNRDNMRAALRKLVNATFAVRDEMWWGTGTRVRLRQPQVRRLVLEPDDRVAPALPGPGVMTHSARGAEIGLHLLPAQELFGL